MTNEQLVTYIQQDGKELLPILWERVKRLCFMLCGRALVNRRGQAPTLPHVCRTYAIKRHSRVHANNYEL